jgi:hypothetical protein
MPHTVAASFKENFFTPTILAIPTGTPFEQFGSLTIPTDNGQSPVGHPISREFWILWPRDVSRQEYDIATRKLPTQLGTI